MSPQTTLRTWRRESVLWAEIASRNNTIGTALMASLEETLQVHAAEGSLRTLALRGSGEKLFCPGLDLLEVGFLDRLEMGRFMERFSRLSLALFSHPKPILAVVNGHALAGGFLLAGCCDFRIGRRGARVGLTDLNQVVPVPLPTLGVLESRFGWSSLSTALFPGEYREMREAARLGWVDHVVEDGLDGAAEEWALRLAAQSPAAFAAMKRSWVKRVSARVRTEAEAGAETFLDCWFSDEAQERIRQLLARLGGVGRTPE